jgi:translation initiation factor eIF-2B subunit delta
MSGDGNGAPGGAPNNTTSNPADTTPKPEATGPADSTKKPAAKDPAPAPAQSANTEKLTPAQLKAKAKAEKAARRAQVKEARAAAAAAAGTSAGQEKGGPADAKGGKAKGGKQDGQPVPPKGSMSGHRPSVHWADEKKEQEPKSNPLHFFSHVPIAKRIPLSQAHKDVHPAVLAVGQQMATNALNDSIARLKAMLLAFRKVGVMSSRKSVPLLTVG